MFESSRTIKCYGMCSKRIPLFFSSTESTTLKIRYSAIFEIIQKYSKIHKNFRKFEIFDSAGK